MRTFALIMCAAVACCASGVHAEDAAAFDIVITNGHIIDGAGAPWYSGDVGIRGGQIAAIGNLVASARASFTIGGLPHKKTRNPVRLLN